MLITFTGIEMIQDAHHDATQGRRQSLCVRTRNLYGIVLHQLATNHVLVRKMLNPA